MVGILQGNWKENQKEERSLFYCVSDFKSHLALLAAKTGVKICCPDEMKNEILIGIDTNEGGTENRTSH